MALHAHAGGACAVGGAAAGSAASRCRCQTHLCTCCASPPRPRAARRQMEESVGRHLRVRPAGAAGPLLHRHTCSVRLGAAHTGHCWPGPEPQQRPEPPAPTLTRRARPSHPPAGPGSLPPREKESAGAHGCSRQPAMAIPNRNHGLGMLAGTRMGPGLWQPPRGGSAPRLICASSRGRRRRQKSLEVRPARRENKSKVRWEDTRGARPQKKNKMVTSKPANLTRRRRMECGACGAVWDGEKGWLEDHLGDPARQSYLCVYRPLHCMAR